MSVLASTCLLGASVISLASCSNSNSFASLLTSDDFDYANNPTTNNVTTKENNSLIGQLV